MTDTEQPQDPAQAGQELQDPNDMTEQETPETDDTDAQERTDNLSIAWTGGMTYAVFSVSDDGQNAYKVDLSELSCTCDHAGYNEQSTESCYHIQAAIETHDSSPDLKRFTFEQLADLFVTTHETLQSVQQAGSLPTSQSEGGSGTSNADSGGNDDQQDDDEGDVVEIDVDDDTLREELYDWFDSAAGFNDFDPDIIELNWVEAEGTRGIHVNRQPFGGEYYDLDESEWVDKDGFEDEKDKLKDSILSARDEFEWYSEPDYAWVISESDAKELVA